MNVGPHPPYCIGWRGEAGGRSDTDGSDGDVLILTREVADAGMCHE